IDSAAQPLAPDDRITAASILLENGRIAEAQAIVSELRDVAQPDQQVLFLSGALYFIGGRYDEAAAEFRRMLTRDPTLVRPRLELARALYMSGQYEAARYHFEQTLAAPLPEQVRRNILGYLDAIREHLPTFAFSLDLVSDSNPKQATTSRVVQIGNLLFQLNDSARAREAQGVLLTGQGRYPLPADNSLFLRGYVEYYDYAGRDLDLLYAQALGGKHVNLGGHGVDIETGGHAAIYAGKTLYSGAIGRVSDFIRLAPALGLNLALDAKQLDYADYPFLDGWQHTASADLRRALDSRSSISGGIAFTLGTAREQAYAFERPALMLRYLREWQGGWISSLSWQGAHFHFGGVDPFFGSVRTDRENLAEFGIVNRRLSYKGFSPRLTLGYADRRSNIELYSYHRAYLRVGLVSEF
ncbi:MAG TPA: surface lipoprotein assembly modifier, partial [Burkholderiales bacterium]